MPNVQCIQPKTGVYFSRITPEEIEKVFSYGKMHLYFCLKLYGLHVLREWAIVCVLYRPRTERVLNRFHAPRRGNGRGPRAVVEACQQVSNRRRGGRGGTPVGGVDLAVSPEKSIIVVSEFFAPPLANQSRVFITLMFVLLMEVMVKLTSLVFPKILECSLLCLVT